MHKILICISAWKDTLLLILVPGVGTAYSQSNTPSPWRTGGEESLSHHGWQFFGELFTFLGGFLRAGKTGACQHHFYFSETNNGKLAKKTLGDVSYVTICETIASFVLAF